MANRILGMGDVVSLVERAQAVYDLIIPAMVCSMSVYRSFLIGVRYISWKGKDIHFRPTVNQEKLDFCLFLLIPRILPLENRIFWEKPQKSVA